MAAGNERRFVMIPRSLFLCDVASTRAYQVSAAAKDGDAKRAAHPLPRLPEVPRHKRQEAAAIASIVSAALAIATWSCSAP